MVSPSFGTVVLLAYLAENQLSIPSLLLIDGLAIVPPSGELAEILPQEDVVYRQLTDYFIEMLGDDKLPDSQLRDILAHNLRRSKKGYQTKLSCQSSLSYLSLYAGQDNVILLESVADRVEKLLIFTEQDLSLPHLPIEAEDHLLMLTQPEFLVGSLANEFFD